MKSKPVIERINAEKHLRLLGDFSCVKEETMREFLLNDAIEYDLNGEGNTFLVLDNKKLIAYFTLKCSSVQIKDDQYDGEIRNIPTIEISKIAVDDNCEGKGIGKNIMNYIIAMTNKLKEKIAIKYLMVFSISSAVSFYTYKFKFEEFGENYVVYSCSNDDKCTIPLFIVI